MADCQKCRCTLKLFWILCGLGIPIFILAWMGFSHEKAEVVIENQLEGLKKGQVSETYFMLTTPHFQETIPLEKYQQFIRTYPILTHHQTRLMGPQQGNQVTLLLKSAQDET